jgi:hypothetical protein
MQLLNKRLDHYTGFGRPPGYTGEACYARMLHMRRRDFLQPSVLASASIVVQCLRGGHDGGGFGWYTPIAGTQRKGFKTRPIYYGRLMFAQAGAGQLVDSKLTEPQPDDVIAAHSLKTDSGLKTILLSKNPDSCLRITIDPGHRAERAAVFFCSLLSIWIPPRGHGWRVGGEFKRELVKLWPAYRSPSS